MDTPVLVRVLYYFSSPDKKIVFYKWNIPNQIVRIWFLFQRVLNIITFYLDTQIDIQFQLQPAWCLKVGIRENSKEDQTGTRSGSSPQSKVPSEKRGLQDFIPEVITVSFISTDMTNQVGRAMSTTLLSFL